MTRVAESDAMTAVTRDCKPWAGLSEQWNCLGPPLRPGAEDLRRLHAGWLASLPGGIPARKIDILLLGVTPEIARFDWAPSAFMTAIDSSAPMIQAVWPGDGPVCRAVHGDWLHTPFADNSFDLILTDAGLVVLGGLDRIPVLSRELHRVLRPGGRVVARHFARSSAPASLAALVAAVAAGQVRNFNELKLALLTTLPGNGADRGVELPRALESFNHLFPDREALSARMECPPDIIATIDAYRGRADRYIFPTHGEIAASCGQFTVTSGPAGGYPLAECCPVYVLAPKS